MSVDEPNMDDWAALWAEEPPLAEREEVHAIAARVSRRARLFEYADLAVAIVITAGVLLALLVRPSPVTLAVGFVAAAGVFWPCWQRHQLKSEIKQLVSISDRFRLIELQHRRLAAELRRSTLALLGTPIAILLFAMLTHSLERGGSLHGFSTMLLEALTDLPVGPIIIATMLTVIVQQVRTVRRLRSELSETEALGGEYRRELRLDQTALSGLVSS